MTLPIHAILPELRTHLASSRAAILSAPPGSGKTTVVPVSLLAEPWLAGQRILMLEPRRLAAKLAASFMARQLHEEVGQRVGYRVRFESKVSAATRLEVLTEGVLTRRLQDDPELADVGLVIFDEFHERSLQADLALALCLDVMTGLREDLKLLIMSATLDTGPLAGFLSGLFAGTPVVCGSGRSHPVGVEYLPGRLTHQPFPREIAGEVAAAVARALHEHPGDILAFLPGAFEIRLTAELLQSRLAAKEIAIHPLYGDLNLAAQTAAVQPDPAGRRRVILATPIAETSVTIEGIHTVVDSGFRRLPQFDPNSGLSRLTTQRISKAAATQRAGRAGRLGPGHCYRLWSLGEEHSLRPFDPPEIQGADLCQLVLALARWGVTRPDSLRWLDPPPAGHFSQAQELLRELGALDSENRLSRLGKRIADLPVHPRLGLMLSKALEAGAMALACDLAALLSERELSKGRDKSADIEERLQMVAAFRSHGPAAVRSLEGDPDACRRVLQTGRQLRGLLSGNDRPEQAGNSPGALLALAFPDRIAQRRPGSQGQYKLTSGRGARLAAHDHLTACEYLAVAELDAGKAEGRIFLAAPLAREELLAVFSEKIVKEEKVFWDEETQSVKALRLTRLAALVLEAAPLKNPAPETVLPALLAGLRSRGLAALPWSEKTIELQARLESLRHWQPEADWPDLSAEHLLITLEEWLAPFLAGMTRLEQLRKLDLGTILVSRLNWRQQQELAELAPTHCTVPSGSRIKLRYMPGDAPILAVRLQEMFGLTDTPMVCRGTVPITLHLLSPAQRPIQITRDLRGFWQSTYHEVKKELKGRYPKHYWPEDPLVAEATARTKPRK
ncbi:ATP-dependent helicase HrpB [Thiovibrio sp. JS02]